MTDQFIQFWKIPFLIRFACQRDVGFLSGPTYTATAEILMGDLTTIRSAEIVADRYCRDCGERLLASEHRCSELRKTDGGSYLVAVPDQRLRSESAGKSVSKPMNSSDVLNSLGTVLNDRAAVIGIIAVIGPLGLPILWMSPRFKRSTKILTTGGYILLTTVIPLAIAWYWLDYSLQPLLDVMGS